MVQVEEISKEMDGLKNCIENEVSVWNKAWLKSCRLKSWSHLAFAHLDAGTAEYSRGCDWICKAETAVGEKQCCHKGARPSKRGTTQVVMLEAERLQCISCSWFIKWYFLCFQFHDAMEAFNKALLDKKYVEAANQLERVSTSLIMSMWALFQGQRGYWLLIL